MATSILDEKDYSKNHYRVLGVLETANEDELKKAYRKIAKFTHPDLVNKSESEYVRNKLEDMFKQANSSYEILSNNNIRADYDLNRQSYREKTKKTAEELVQVLIPGKKPEEVSENDINDAYFELIKFFDVKKYDVMSDSLRNVIKNTYDDIERAYDMTNPVINDDFCEFVNENARRARARSEQEAAKENTKRSQNTKEEYSFKRKSPYNGKYKDMNFKSFSEIQLEKGKVRKSIVKNGVATLGFAAFGIGTFLATNYLSPESWASKYQITIHALSTVSIATFVCKSVVFGMNVVRDYKDMVYLSEAYEKLKVKRKTSKNNF